ncbi:hypothetical protein Ahia01_001232100 [Argonauta hians]
MVKCAEKEVIIEKYLQKCEENWAKQMFILKSYEVPKIELYSKQIDLSADSPVVRESTATPEFSASPFTSRPSSCHSLSSWSVLKLALQDGETSSMVLLSTNIDSLLADIIDNQDVLYKFLQNNDISSLHEEIEKWYNRLLKVESVLEMWHQVQEFLEQLIQVYSNRDIQQLLPVETKSFVRSYLKYCCFINSVEKLPKVLLTCEKKWVISLLEHILYTFEKCHEAIYHKVDYFQNLCPRLYFLSSEEVYQILCYGNDVTVLYKYLKKILPNIEELKFKEGTEEKKMPASIEGVFDANFGYMELSEPVACDGAVYQWLHSLLLTLQESLYNQLTTVLRHQSATGNGAKQNEELIMEERLMKKDVIWSVFLADSYIKHLTDIFQDFYWIIKVPPQLVQLMSQLHFSHRMDNILEHSTTMTAIKNYISELNGNCDRISTVIRILQGERMMGRHSDLDLLVEPQNSSKLELPASICSEQIAKLQSLLLCQCHFKDLLQEMLKSSVDPHQTFCWQSQLKYHLNNEGKHVEIKNVYSTFKYGFEYLGSTPYREMRVSVTQTSLFQLFRTITSFKAGLCIGSQKC